MARPTTAPILRFRCGCGKLDALSPTELVAIRRALDETPEATDAAFLRSMDALWTEGRIGLLCRECTG